MHRRVLKLFVSSHSSRTNLFYINLTYTNSYSLKFLSFGFKGFLKILIWITAVVTFSSPYFGLKCELWRFPINNSSNQLRQISPRSLTMPKHSCHFLRNERWCVLTLLGTSQVPMEKQNCVENSRDQIIWSKITTGHKLFICFGVLKFNYDEINELWVTKGSDLNIFDNMFVYKAKVVNLTCLRKGDFR